MATLQNTYNGGAGNDLIFGSEGDDIIFGGAGNDTLSGGTGNDIMQGGEGNDALFGGDGNDFLFGQGGADTLVGGNGDDYLAGNGGGDRFDGGAGVDTVAFYDSTSGVTVDLGAGRGYDAYASGATFTGIENVNGTAFADCLVGDGGDNVLDGRDGNDYLAGGLGNNTLVGGNGDDYMVANGGRDSFDGGAGTDRVVFSYSTEGVTVDLRAGRGYGGYAAGATFSGIEIVDGTAYSDCLVGDAGDNVLNGAGDADYLEGGLGNNTLVGGDGNDYMVANGGRDSFDGGAGTDRVVFSYSTAGVTVDLGAGKGYGGYAEGATFTGVEIVDGSAYADYLYGDAGDNVLNGGGGNDFMQGGLGNNTLVGGDGNDYMIANGGRDSFDGGAGVDTVAFSNSTNSVMVLLGSGIGYGGYADGTTFTGIENVQGSIYSDYLVGDAGDNSLYGNDGNDYLSGGEGNNFLVGGDGDDYLTAGSGADVLAGGNGNDSLTGGRGDDRLSGGAGNDTYYFGRGDGGDMVMEYDSIIGNTDVAVFRDVAANQIWFRHVGNDLEASIIGTSDTLTIQNWYSGSTYHVEQFRSTDGHVLSDSKVESLVQAMASFAPPASGQTTLPTNYQTALQPVIAANWQ